jgi:thymidylate kinase
MIFCIFSLEGTFIAFAGISGSGKSSLASELAMLCDGVSFHETEEEEWPNCIREVKAGREFSALIVFRALRVDALYRAKELSESGTNVIVDSYYDKLTFYYFGKPGMDWLLPSDDPYFEIAKKMMAIDIDQLPDVDCIVLLDVSYPDWVRLLKKRNRSRDRLKGFVESFDRYKDYTKNAVLNLCRNRGIRCVQFNTHYSSPKIEAKKLYQLLIENHILEDNHANTQATLE